MTLLVFLGVLVSLLILRLMPNLLLQMVLAVPPHRLVATMGWMRARKVGIVLSRKRIVPVSGIPLSFAPSGRRARLVLVSSSLLILAALVSTAFWTWHSTALMMLLR
jgi:hypothetical protein